MRLSVNCVAALAAAASFLAVTSLPASAECKRYGFTVNDYGKDGPTKDAKDLLDKLIATKMAEKGVKDYHTGKKSVSCELFLNFIVFDEHTCTAEATVCWGGTPLPRSEEAAAEPAAAAKSASDETASKPSRKKKNDIAKTTNPAAAETKPVAVRVPDPKPAPVEKSEEAQGVNGQGSTGSPDSAAAPLSETPATAAAPEVSAPTAPAATAATKPGTSANSVETGSLNDAAKKQDKPKTEDAAATSATVAPVKPTAKEPGYPTPMPPQPQDGPSP